VCEQLRLIPTESVGIIIVSANASRDERSGWCRRFLAKPFSPAELLVAVDELVAAWCPEQTKVVAACT